MSFNSCLAIELWIFHINAIVFSFVISVSNTFNSLLLFTGFPFVLWVLFVHADARKLLLSLMSFPSDYMRNTFSVSGAFLYFQKITQFQNAISM